MSSPNTSETNTGDTNIASTSYIVSTPQEPPAPPAPQQPTIHRRLSGKASVINPPSIAMLPIRTRDERRVVSAPNSPTRSTVFALKLSRRAEDDNDEDIEEEPPTPIDEDITKSRPDDVQIVARTSEPKLSQSGAEPQSPTSSTSSGGHIEHTSFPRRALSISRITNIFVKLKRPERQSFTYGIGHNRSRSWTLSTLSPTKSIKRTRTKSHHIESSSGPTPLTHPILEPTSAASSLFMSVDEHERKSSSSSSGTKTGKSEAASSEPEDGQKTPTNSDSKAGSSTIPNKDVSVENGEKQSQNSVQTSSHLRKALVEMEDLFVCRDGVDVPRLLRASRASLLQRAVMLSANALVDETWKCTICGPKHRSDGSFKVTIHYSAFAAHSPRPDPKQPVALSQARSVPGLMTVLERQLIRERTEPVAAVQPNSVSDTGGKEKSNVGPTLVAQEAQQR